MGLLIIIGFCILYFLCSTYFKTDKVIKSSTNKETASERNELSYYDYDSQSERMISSGKECRRLISYDAEGRIYNYYIDKYSGTFLGAKYFGAKNQDLPIKYRKMDIESWLKNGVISSEKDLYERWK